MERIAIAHPPIIRNHLLIELISSVRRHGPPGRFAICVLDAGMTPEQVSRLAPLVDEISQCRWRIKLPARLVRGRESLKANLCRPFHPVSLRCVCLP